MFFAVSDKDWILDGANVHISIIGFDDGTDTVRVVDGRGVAAIQPNLSGLGVDISTAQKLAGNKGIGFIGTTKKAPLDIPFRDAIRLLSQPNPNGRPNSDVIVPYLNAEDIVRRTERYWVIDFGAAMSLEDASLYEKPFEHVKQMVYPLRVNHREPIQKRFWWRLARPCPELIAAIKKLPRFLVTSIVSKYRVFCWQTVPTNPDHQLVVFANPDDYLFGLLQSRIHEVWGLKQGTRLETRPRYTPTTCFETFPFPIPTADQTAAIAAAAKHLDELRSNWLNPPEWTKTEVLEFPGSVDGPCARYVHDPNDRGVGTVRYPRLAPKDEATAKQLQKRTLTNLYNARPEWLRQAHDALDRAVFAAYGWDPAMSDDDLLAELLGLNLKRPSSERHG